MIELESSMDNPKIYFYLLITLNFICNMLIMATIAKTEKMRSRASKMVFNFAAINSMYFMHGLGITNYVAKGFGVDVNEGKGYCMMGVMEVGVTESSLVIMLLLLSDALVKSDKISDGLVFGIYNLAVFSFFVLCTTLCLTMNGIIMILEMIVLVTIALSVGALFCKELYRGYRSCRKRPLAKDTVSRMVVASTYIYSCAFFVFSLIIEPITDSLLLPMLITTPRYVGSVALIIYLSCINPSFRINLLDILGCGLINVEPEKAEQCEQEHICKEKKSIQNV